MGCASNGLTGSTDNGLTKLTESCGEAIYIGVKAPLKSESNSGWPETTAINSMKLENGRTYTVVELDGTKEPLSEEERRRLITSVEDGLKELVRDKLINPVQKVGLLVDPPRADPFVYSPLCRSVRVAFTVHDNVFGGDLGPDLANPKTLESGVEYRLEDHWSLRLYEYAFKNGLLIRN